MDTAKRTKNGGNSLVLFELDSSNQPAASLTANTNCIWLTCQEDSDSPINTSEEILKTEDGLTADVDQEYSGTTEATLLENDSIKTDFLAYTVRGKRYGLARYIGKNNGNHEWLFAIVRINPLRSNKQPKGKLPFKAIHIPPLAAVTWDSTDMTAIETALSGLNIHPTTATIPAGQEDVTTRTAIS